MSEPEELKTLTIAQTAARLGVTEPRLRRALKLPEFADRTLTETQTRTGTRTGTGIPLALVLDLQAFFERKTTAPGVKRRKNNTNGNANVFTSGSVPEDAPPPPADLIPVYHRVMNEQAARIDDLKARVEFLEAALQREQENTARGMALRAIEAPHEEKTEQRTWWRFWKKRE